MQTDLFRYELSRLTLLNPFYQFDPVFNPGVEYNIYVIRKHFQGDMAEGVSDKRL